MEGYLWTDDPSVYRHLDLLPAVSNLTGTRQGLLVLPPYLAPEPINTIGKGFDPLHYNIARWRDGMIVEMRASVDSYPRRSGNFILTSDEFVAASP